MRMTLSKAETRRALRNEKRVMQVVTFADHAHSNLTNWKMYVYMTYTTGQRMLVIKRQSGKRCSGIHTTQAWSRENKLDLFVR